MSISENEVATLIDRLRALNVVAWELVSLVPAKGNAPLLNIIESVVNETDALAELKAEEAAMEWQDEPAYVRIVDDNAKVIEDAVYRGTLRAVFVQKQLSESERNILLNETLGIGPTEIARRNGVPESDIESESDKIRKQIDRSKKKK